MNFGKYKDTHYNQTLTVDSWKQSYDENGEMVETYSGEEEIEETETHKYLGFVLSNNARNAPNIEDKKGKAISTTRNIMKMVSGLQTDTFQCTLY